MKSFFTFFILAAIVFLSLAPPVSAAILNIWEGTSGGGCNISGSKPCTFCDALIVTSNIIKYLWNIATFIAVTMIIYGALRLMVAGGSEEAVQKAKEIIFNAVLGLIIALAAWAIINTILHVLAGNLNFPWNQIRCSNTQ